MKQLFFRTQVWLLSTFAMCCVAIAQDKVHLESGTVLTGEISSLEPDQVTITVRGKSQNVPTNTIKRVSFDGEPRDFGNTKEFVAQGQWDQADAEIKKIDVKSLEGNNLQQDYIYYRWLIAGQLALQGKGDPKDPRNGLFSYLKNNPKSHHYYELGEVAGALASSMGDYSVARSAYSAIGKAPFPEYQAKSSYYLGTVALSENKPDDALKEFDKVKNAPAANPATQRYQKLASVAAIRSNIIKGQAQTAVDQLLKLIDESDSTDTALFANIYNTLGEAHLALSEPTNAKLAFLATDLMFATDSEKHAEALYNLAKLWEQTGNPQRATDARTRLKEQYGGTIWARK